MKGNDRLEYDIQMRGRAGVAATLRALVAGYLLYTGWRLYKGSASGSSDMSITTACIIAVVFAAAAAAFGIYTFRQWRRDVEAARMPEPEDDDNYEQEAEGDSDGEN